MLKHKVKKWQIQCKEFQPLHPSSPAPPAGPVEEGIKVAIEEIITIGIIIDQIIEIDQEADGITTGQVIEVVITQIIIDKVTQDLTTDRTHNGLIEIEVRVEVEMKIMAMISLEVEAEIEIKGEESNLDLDLIQG